MWYFETLYPDIKLGLKGKLIYKKKTPYQQMRIYDTERFGKTLILDGAIQTTEKDEFIYHEMLTHTVMLIHPSPKKILIIGGGDGGILREVLKYKIVNKVYLVEIDKEVVEISQKYLKSICKNSFKDKRTEIVFSDGAEFVKTTKDKFDIVIVDSPDPVGVAKTLFREKFYRDVYSVLNPEGIMIRQTGSTILQAQEVKSNFGTLKKVYPFVWIHLVAIPTYIGGFFSLMVGSKKISFLDLDLDSLEKKFEKLRIKTKYYTPYIHIASLFLPEYVKKRITL